MLENCLNALKLTIVADDEEQAAAFRSVSETWTYEDRHSVEVVDARHLQSLGLEKWARSPNLLKYTSGHPCWRKVTDPFLVAGNQPVVIIDPDVYFLRPFQFPIPSETAICLMWQPPNCMYPPTAVDEAFRTGASLADHVDIGVAIVVGGVDWAWLDNFLGKLSLNKYSKFMHIEAIVWSALAMHHGGFHLDPERWVCYQAGWRQKLRRRLGYPESTYFDAATTKKAIAIHAGGVAKHKIANLEQYVQTSELDDTKRVPFVAYKASKWTRKKLMTKLLRKLGASVG